MKKKLSIMDCDVSMIVDNTGLRIDVDATKSGNKEDAKKIAEVILKYLKKELKHENRS